MKGLGVMEKAVPACERDPHTRHRRYVNLESGFGFGFSGLRSRFLDSKLEVQGLQFRV